MVYCFEFGCAEPVACAVKNQDRFAYMPTLNKEKRNPAIETPIIRKLKASMEWGMRRGAAPWPTRGSEGAL